MSEMHAGDNHEKQETQSFFVFPCAISQFIFQLHTNFDLFWRFVFFGMHFAVRMSVAFKLNGKPAFIRFHRIVKFIRRVKKRKRQFGVTNESWEEIMKKIDLGKNLAAMLMVWTLLVAPLAIIGQTRITMPKNKYKVQDDVKLGQQASAQVRQQMPILNDSETERYVSQVGERLVRAIPSQFQQPAFDYQFDVVNARDINAFALPGGPMFVNRGMIESAAREGEMAGVMAHEIAHVALRHGTAGATKSQNPAAQLPAIGGAILGAILGGTVGSIAQTAGQIGSGAIITKYSREYETQADILGAQILANAGYDPRDLANMFRTIERESGGSRSPEWLSSHPNPGNRYENINREAEMLRVKNPVTNTAQFERIQSKLRRLPRAQSMEEIGKNSQGNNGGQNPMGNGRYGNVARPSTQTRVFSSGNSLRMNVPSNWQEFPTQDGSSVWFAPQGAYGNEGITHGAMIGVAKSNGSSDLGQATEEYVNGLLQAEGNNYLRQNTDYARATVGGRNGYATVLSGRSPLTNRNETVTVYTTQLRSGDLFYVVTVAPENESAGYNSAFRNMINSLRING